MPELAPDLATLLDGYDAVFCDIWGVLHDGRAAFPPAVAALKAARAAGKIVVLVSNVPKPNDPIPGQLERLGAPRACWDAIATSGDAIRTELAARAPGPMYKIGPPEDGALWEGLALTRSEDLAAARFVAVSGLTHEGAETPEDYADLLGAARARDLELVCANPDIVVRVGDRLVWCAGALARDYAALGGRVVMAGKPYPPIYRLAYAAADRAAGRPLARARILAIGDGIGTDVAGAQAEGLDCLFIAAGMHGQALLTAGAPDAEKVAAALAVEGVAARYMMATLA